MGTSVNNCNTRPRVGKHWLAVLSIVLIMISRPLNAYGAGNWLSGWGKRVMLTINKNYIASALTNFPVLVHLSTSSGYTHHDVSFVFTELQNNANQKKIAVTTDDGTTQCYVEIEYWNTTNKQAYLWVNAPSVSSTANTTLYLYFDSTQTNNTAYVGDPGSVTAKNVWDSNYIAVWHLRESPTGSAPQFKDSKNSNDGTANNMVAGDQQTCAINGGLNFNGNNAKVPTNTGTSVKGLTQYTVEAWVNTGVLNGAKHLIYEESISTNALSRVKFHIDATNRLSLAGRALDTDSLTTWVSPTTALSTNTWYYLAGVFDSVSDVHHFMINGTDTTNTVTASTISNTAPYDTPTIGARPSSSEFWSGKIDEVRISITARSVDWLKASYYSGGDQLIDYGSLQLKPVPEFPYGVIPALGVGFAILWVEIKALRGGTEKVL